MRERNWSEAAKRWAVLREAYPNQATTWIRGAIAHIETGELDQAESLLAYAQMLSWPSKESWGYLLVHSESSLY